jgi:hypothetical protein
MRVSLGSAANAGGGHCHLRWLVVCRLCLSGKKIMLTFVRGDVMKRPLTRDG